MPAIGACASKLSKMAQALPLSMGRCRFICDWGRDTMIALPGLALTTGQTDVAQQILLAFSRFVDGGMLPNNFPDSGELPEYNTIDATLWYFEAIRQYFAETRDIATLQKLF